MATPIINEMTADDVKTHIVFYNEIDGSIYPGDKNYSWMFDNYKNTRLTKIPIVDIPDVHLNLVMDSRTRTLCIMAEEEWNKL